MNWTELARSGWLVVHIIVPTFTGGSEEDLKQLQ